MHNRKLKEEYDKNDLKGAFSLKVLDARREEYKRKRIRINELNTEVEDLYEQD